MTTSTRGLSTWITEVAYRNGFLALFTSRGVALLYGPSDERPDGVPSWIPGLLKAGRVGRNRSVGRAYNHLVRGGGYAYQRVDKTRVGELREMMTGRT